MSETITIPFHDLDKDNSGRLSKEEVEALKKPFLEAKEATHRKVQAAYDEIDAAMTDANKNNNNYIDNGLTSWYDPLSKNGFDEVSFLIEKLKAKNLVTDSDINEIFDWSEDYFWGSRKGFSIDRVKQNLHKVVDRINRWDDISWVEAENIKSYDDLIGKTVGDYHIPLTVVGGTFLPNVEITSTLAEKLLYARFNKARGSDDVITQGGELTTFLSTYFTNDNLEIQSNVSAQNSASHSDWLSSSRSGSSVSASQSIKQSGSTGELGPDQLNILHNETGMHFWDDNHNYVTHLNPNDVKSPTFVIMWPTGNLLPDGKEVRIPKTEWTYGEMFRYYFTHQAKNSVSGIATQ